MAKIRKNFLVGCSTITILFLVSLIFMYVWVGYRLNKTFEPGAEIVTVPEDLQAISRGEHLVQNLAGCTDCHGQTLAGSLLYNDRWMGQIVASNLTPGRGGIGGEYTPADWERAIRHGLGPDGKPLIFVMSGFYQSLSDADMVAMIAYLERLPPVDNELPSTRLGFLSRLIVFSDATLIPAWVINHAKQHPAAMTPGVTLEYGRYLAVSCSICHGEDFAGGLSVGAGLNLTPAGNLGEWTEVDFIRVLRTGRTPDGRWLDADTMPWRRLSRLTEDELKAIWVYLSSLPATHGEG